MSSERFKRIEDLYHAALEIEPGERGPFLESHCGGDTDLLKEIEELLSYEAVPGSVLEGSPGDLAADLLAPRKSPDKTIGKKIGRYRVEELIGEGGMGTVYRAYDSRLARHVALKVLSPGAVTDEDRVQRFRHEARAASALNHPHILTVYELGEDTGENGDKVHFIATEFVDGETLDELIYSETTSTSQILAYLAQTAHGLAKAHAAGIVHRDLKPENIMVSRDGYAKILDFGLAKLTDSEGILHDLQKHKSRSGVILGTLGYMSPEQARGSRHIDHGSDIFALGCILYEALAKRKAFEAETAIDSLHKIIHDDPKPLREVVPGIPLELVELVEGCLRKDTEARTVSASAIARDLEIYASGLRERPEAPALASDARTIIRDTNSTRENQTFSISGQRRQVTAMFTDVSAVADQLEDLDPEESIEILNGLWDVLDVRIREGGGRVTERFAGTGLAVWGSEDIRESDPEEAVRTALGLQTAAAQYVRDRIAPKLGWPTGEQVEFAGAGPLKIGISTGTVLLSNSGDTEEFLTAGTAVNAAKRVLSRSSVGEVLISRDTYRHIRGVFVVEEVPPEAPTGFNIGKHDPRIYSIGGTKPKAFRMETRGVEGVETQMVGREPEMIRLQSVLDGVTEDKELQVVTVVGEAGIGKSRLLFEFHDRLDLSSNKYYVFKARAREPMRDTPFSFVRELFAHRFGISEGVSKEEACSKFVAGVLELAAASGDEFGDAVQREMKATFIGHLVGFDFSGSPFLKEIVEDEKQVKDRALVYSAQLFAIVASRYPTVFYLDDLHWADDESLEFFDRISQDCSDSAILMIELTRPMLFEERPHRGEGLENRTRLDLAPLTRRESGKLVENILQKADAVPKQLLDLLVSNTEGNPFYVEELVKMLIEQSVVSVEGESWVIDEGRLDQISIPSTLTGVLQSRLGRLSPWENRVLQRASVVGRDFWDSALSSFEKDVNVPTILDSLRRKELLFRKERSSLVDSNEYVFKHALLRDVVYETLSVDERRTWHAETAEWLIGSSGRAQRDYPAQIAEHFEKAGNIEQSARWYGRAAELARRSYALDTAEALFHKALRLLDQAAGRADGGSLDPFEVLGWRLSLGTIFHAQARFRESENTFKDLLEIAEDLGSKLWQAHALRSLSLAQFDAGENRASLESAGRAVRLASECGREETGDSLLLKANAMFRQGRALVSLGKFDEAIAIAEEVLKDLEEIDGRGANVRAVCLHLLSAANMFLGRLREAQEFESLSVRISKEIGDLRVYGNGLNNLGFQSYVRGEAEEAIASYEKALAVNREIGNRTSEIMVRSNIFGARILKGEYEAAEAGLRGLIGEVSDGQHFLIPEMYRFLAESLIGQGRIDEAAEYAARSLRMSEERENQETIGEAWRVLGIAASLSGHEVTVEGEPVDADECFRKAVGNFEGARMEANLAQTLHNYASHCAATGEKARSDSLFQREREISARLELNTAAKSPYFVSRIR